MWVGILWTTLLCGPQPCDPPWTYQFKRFETRAECEAQAARVNALPVATWSTDRPISWCVPDKQPEAAQVPR